MIAFRRYFFVKQAIIKIIWPANAKIADENALSSVVPAKEKFVSLLKNSIGASTSTRPKIIFPSPAPIRIKKLKIIVNIKHLFILLIYLFC